MILQATNPHRLIFENRCSIRPPRTIAPAGSGVGSQSQTGGVTVDLLLLLLLHRCGRIVSAARAGSSRTASAPVSDGGSLVARSSSGEGRGSGSVAVHEDLGDGERGRERRKEGVEGRQERREQWQTEVNQAVGKRRHSSQLVMQELRQVTDVNFERERGGGREGGGGGGEADRVVD